MRPLRKHLSVLLALTAGVVSTACHTEDPGPLQAYEKSFGETDFDRLEMGNAFNIRVEQGNEFAISARGDRRNIDDLLVYRSGSKLIIRYDDLANRTHQTFISITMPTLEGVHFSGATESFITGFDSNTDLEISLSGASKCRLESSYREVAAVLSAASQVRIIGSGHELQAQLSAASEIIAFEFPVAEADVSLSGASQGSVAVSDQLKAVATGASSLVYRGSPSVIASVSGASVVRQE